MDHSTNFRALKGDFHAKYGHFHADDVIGGVAPPYYHHQLLDR